MLTAAERLSKGLEPCPEFLQASAEALAFEDATFDGVISTYGVIFAEDPSTAISEMARVLRPGGRLALATWADDPEGYIARFFGLIGRWSEAPPPAASPFDWGRPDWLAKAMAGRFEIVCREQTTLLYAPDTATVWEEYVNGFGPVAATHAALGCGCGPASSRAARSKRRTGAPRKGRASARSSPTSSCTMYSISGLTNGVVVMAAVA
jgi:SAM-dependent methyltransferase